MAVIGGCEGARTMLPFLVFLIVSNGNNREQSMCSSFYSSTLVFAHSAHLYTPHSFNMHIRSQTSAVAIEVHSE